MSSRNGKLERKDRLLALLDPEHDIGLDGTSLNHLAAALRRSSPSERQKALEKATEAYENALDEVLYENGGILLRKADNDALRSQNSSGARVPVVYVNQLAY